MNTRRKYNRRGRPAGHPPIFCPETQRVYKTYVEAAEDIGGCDVNVRRCCEEIQEDHHGMHFEYYYGEDEGAYSEYTEVEVRNPGRPIDHPPIFCPETLKWYDSYYAAHVDTRISIFKIKRCCLGLSVQAEGKHFMFPDKLVVWTSGEWPDA